MMNTSTNRTRISAVFLSAVLIAGTIAAIFPSFMIGAQADPYYGMDRDYKKVDKKISVSYMKCNNINVNVNGLTLDVFPPFLAGGEIAASAAEEANSDASFYPGNGGSDGGAEFKNFKYICINNNNNTVVGAEEPIPPPPDGVTCEECFSANATLANIIETQLNISGAISIPTFPGVVIPPQVTTIEGLCDFLADEINEGNLPQSIVGFTAVINAILAAGPTPVTNVSETSIELLIECLLDVDFEV